MSTLFDSYLSHSLALLEEGHQLRKLRPIRLTPDGRIASCDGTQSWINLNSNNYLGIHHLSAERIPPKLQDLDPRGKTFEYNDFGSSSSRLLVGDREAYHTLEREIAQALEHPTALLFNSGYHANVGIIGALASPKSCVVIDKYAHASMIDGVILSRLPFFRFRHNDLEHLEKILRQKADSYDTIFVMVESLYSMDGDLAPLPELVALKAQYPQMVLYVDEAHAIGAIGEHGYGYAELTNTRKEIDLLVGTFGKALGGMGAYIACSDAVRKTLINKARSLIYSTMMPEVEIQWNRFAWSLLPYMQEERTRLACYGKQLRDISLGFSQSVSSQSHIIPFVCGSSSAAIQLSEALQEGGFYTLPIRPPTVPQGTERIRISLTADIPPQEIERLSLLLSRFVCNNF